MEMFNTGILALILMWSGCVCGESCTYYDVWDNYESFSCPRTFDTYNEYYCCGSGSSQYCCDHDDFYGVRYVNIPGIIGGVISFLIFVGIIVAFSICCCVASCPLYQRRHQGRVMHGRRAIVVLQTQQTHRMPHPAPRMAHPLQTQYGMNPVYSGHYGNTRPAPSGYAMQPGYGPGVPQPGPMYPAPPPPNYSQAVGTQSQTVTVTDNGGVNPVYPPV